MTQSVSTCHTSVRTRVQIPSTGIQSTSITPVLVGAETGRSQELIGWPDEPNLLAPGLPSLIIINFLLVLYHPYLLCTHTPPATVPFRFGDSGLYLFSHFTSPILVFEIGSSQSRIPQVETLVSRLPQSSCLCFSWAGNMVGLVIITSLRKPGKQPRTNVFISLFQIYRTSNIDQNCFFKGKSPAQSTEIVSSYPWMFNVFIKMLTTQASTHLLECFSWT